MFYSQEKLPEQNKILEKSAKPTYYIRKETIIYKSVNMFTNIISRQVNNITKQQIQLVYKYT